MPVRSDVVPPTTILGAVPFPFTAARTTLAAEGSSQMVASVTGPDRHCSL
jgi:hypothetical protein